MNDINDKQYLMPPDNEAQELYKCCICTEPIHEGYYYFSVYGDPYCEDCLYKEFYKIAESEE